MQVHIFFAMVKCENLTCKNLLHGILVDSIPIWYITMSITCQNFNFRCTHSYTTCVIAYHMRMKLIILLNASGV